MPVARCHVDPAAGELDADELVARWSTSSGVDARHMSALVTRTPMGGARYAAMAWLDLPSLWSTDDVDRIQTGLARTLAQALDVGADRIHVITTVVPSGHVVEGGEPLTW